jgi:hypothetical protein
MALEKKLPVLTTATVPSASVQVSRM